MKVNGDEFLRNIEKQQARANSSSSTHLHNNMDNYYNNINENPNNSGDQELDDIRLNRDSNNKQKYILFGLSLVLLFLITILTLRLLSEDKTKNNFTDNNLINEESYKEVKTYTKEPLQTPQSTKSLDINKIEQAEENIKAEPQETAMETQTKAQSDLFELEKETQKEDVVIETPNTQVEETKKETPKSAITKAEPKPVQKPLVKNNSSVAGIYIQVGAFTKAPDKVLLSKLKKNNLNYITHKMEIKGTLYTKVLVGSYPSRADALQDLSTVKKNFNKNAYILRIK